jgi:hypothetical protein
MRPLPRHLAAIALGPIAAALVLLAADAAGLTPRPRSERFHLVAEDASAPLTRIAIHYAPAADALAMPVWLQLFSTLPETVRVDVAVAQPPDFERFRSQLARAGVGHLERFHPVVVGREITTWSRDRFASLVGKRGQGGVLASPRIETAFGGRRGDMESPAAFSRQGFGVDPRTARVVFEGGDLAASADTLFVGAEILRRSHGRGRADRASVDAELRRHFGQRIVWLGDAPDEVPAHHVMMYMVPIDDHTVLVGDPGAGAALAAADPVGARLDVDGDLAGHQRRFDRVAEILAAEGFSVIRMPVVVLAGAGAYVTYTNGLFDRAPAQAGQRIVYLPTYGVPSLDDAAARQYRDLGFEVRRIDVSGIYHLNGSLGCLVNVMARGGV